MDGWELGSYSAAEFAGGVNIAALAASPQQQQSLAVAQLMEERAKVEAKILSLRQCDARQAELFLQGKRDAVYAFMQAELEKARTDNHAHLIRRYETYLKDFKQEHLYASQLIDLEQQIYAANQPGEYTIELLPATNWKQHPFQDNMVLQRDNRFGLGHATPGADHRWARLWSPPTRAADGLLDPLTASAQDMGW